MTEEKNKLSIKIVIDEKTAAGTYSNGAIINFSETEFIFDFVMLQPQTPQAKVVSRVISNPQHAKRLLLALQENINKYENLHGEIKIRGQSDNQVKFVQ